MHTLIHTYSTYVGMYVLDATELPGYEKSSSHGDFSESILFRFVLIWLLAYLQYELFMFTFSLEQ